MTGFEALEWLRKMDSAMLSSELTVFTDVDVRFGEQELNIRIQRPIASLSVMIHRRDGEPRIGVLT